jgi:hypothetical protein
MQQLNDRKNSNNITLKSGLLILMSLFTFILVPALISIDISQAGKRSRDRARFCSRTAMAAFVACQNEIKDDYWIAVGNCNNISETEPRAECLEDANAEYKEGKELCGDQREARLELCEELGEAPYDPVLDPEDFVDFQEVIDDPASFTPNRYFPLVPGTKWVYFAYDEEGDLAERITVIVKNEIKTIEYPEDDGNLFRCAVVNDLVEEFVGEEGEEDDDSKYSAIEDTDDWYIQHKTTGDVLYMGEIARDYELDLDGRPELVEIEGSWKAGRDSAKPGILMYGNPNPDDDNQQNPYRQEFALGEAEDIGEVISRGEESVNVPAGEYTEDVLKTKDSTPIEPDVLEFKYYAPGVGLIKELNPEDGEEVVLIEKTTVGP